MPTKTKNKDYFIEWLKQIANETKHLKSINVIGHDINRIINENEQLSRDSSLWRYLNKSFICNVIINLTKILEPPRYRNGNEIEGDKSFQCFLKKLDPQFVLSEEEFSSMYMQAPADFLSDCWTDEMIKQTQQEHYAKRSQEYKSLTNSTSPAEYVNNDKKELEKLFKYFVDFRVHYVAHLKETKEIAPIKYEEITTAIESIINLVTKYSLLLDGTRPTYVNYKPKYGNVFEIPWKKTE